VKFQRQGALKERGFSLVEVLVATAIIMIVTLGLASLFSTQNKEMRAIQDKMSALDLESTVKMIIKNEPYCGCLFKGMTFNSALKTWNNFPNGMPSSYNPACNPGSTDIFKVGAKIPASQVEVTSFSMKDISEVVAGSGSYIGHLDIAFSTDSRAIKNASVTMGFTVNATDPIGAKNVGSCGVEKVAAAGSWIPIPTGTGVIHQSTGDGFLVLTSGFYSGIRFYAGPTSASVTPKAWVDARDKYGQGVVSMTVPIKKDEYWKAVSTNVGHSPNGINLTSIFFQPF